LIDQLGSYFVLSTLGILVASIYSSGRTISPKAIVIKIAKFRPFQAFVLAFILKPFDYPAWTIDLLKRLGATLVPLALVSVGYQLRMSQFQGRTQALAIGLGFKLLIAPALILALYSITFGEVRSNLKVTVFESAMAPMIGASIVAIDHELDPPLLTLMVGVGIPLSFLTLPAWWYALQRFA
jgi:predicted permease